jgi:hypothetical protein
MPSTSELITMQQNFEQERGLDRFNTVAHSLERMQGELNEAVEAYLHQTPRDLLIEVIDVTIFAHSLMGRLADHLGLTPEDVDNLVMEKMAINYTKYDEAFFRNGWDTTQAITVARHWWNLGLHEEKWIRDE